MRRKPEQHTVNVESRWSISHPPPASGPTTLVVPSQCSLLLALRIRSDWTGTARLLYLVLSPEHSTVNQPRVKLCVIRHRRRILTFLQCQWPQRYPEWSFKSDDNSEPNGRADIHRREFLDDEIKGKYTLRYIRYKHFRKVYENSKKRIRIGVNNSRTKEKMIRIFMRESDACRLNS